MNGIIFAGCSFTHGHGLWFYNKKIYQKYFLNDTVDNIVNERHHHAFKLKDIFRFPRLVSHELGRFEITRYEFSGNDVESVDFINFIFDFSKKNDSWHTNHHKFDEVDYIILQTSYPERCGVFINERDRIFLSPYDINDTYEMLKNYHINSIDDFKKKSIQQNFERIKKNFMFYENKGIPCFILNLTNDYDDLIESDEFMSKRKIKINYDNNVFNNLKETFMYDKSLLICGDYEYFGENPPVDQHPSKKFHRVIADNIIEKIREYEKNNQ